MNALFNNDRISVNLCDNSKDSLPQINQLISKYAFNNTYLKPGGSKLDNINSALNNINTQYFCVFHDDDLVHFSDFDAVSLVTALSSTSSSDCLYLLSSMGISEDLRFNSKPNMPITKPYSFKAIPYRLPFYPSWIYPNTLTIVNEFKNAVTRKGKYKKTGKYSDVILLETLLEYCNYNYIQCPGIYFHIHHIDNDGASIALSSKINLLIHIFCKISLLQKLRFVSTCALLSMNLLLTKVSPFSFSKTRSSR